MASGGVGCVYSRSAVLTAAEEAHDVSFDEGIRSSITELLPNDGYFLRHSE
jgi:hypothetical protein